jgi:Domain of unknown function (DUF4261)
MTTEDRTSIAIAMVATSTKRLPDAGKIVQASGIAGARRGLLASLFGGKPSSDLQWQDENLVFAVHGGNLAVSLMPAPIPWSELEGPCATAWWWPEATERMRSHRFHFVVALIGGAIEPVERRVLLTNVVREVVTSADPVGVYWGEGTLVHEPKRFLKMTSSISGTNIPGTVWLDVRVEPVEDNAVRCFTTGLAPLGFREIEVVRSTLPPDEVMGFIGDTACYIINNRKQIKHGETIGRTATERYQVSYAASMFDRGKLMRLELV